MYTTNPKTHKAHRTWYVPASTGSFLSASYSIVGLPFTL